MVFAFLSKDTNKGAAILQLDSRLTIVEGVVQALPPPAVPTLAAVLATTNGNKTGGKSIEVSTGDGIAFGTGATPTPNAIEWGAGLVGSMKLADGPAAGAAQYFYLEAGKGDDGNGGHGASIEIDGGYSSDGADSYVFGGSSKNGAGGATVSARGGVDTGNGGLDRGGNVELLTAEAKNDVDQNAGDAIIVTGGSRGTGSANFEVRTTPPGSTGSTRNAPRRAFKVDGKGNVLGSTGSALATNATDGFTYIPSCAGIPTGTPTAFTGAAPMVVDSTNNKLYVYIGGAWRAMN